MGIPVKVSLIIPVYNGAEFLRRIFDCAIYQTLPEVEVIAINDCSPNMRDAEIMHEYEERYPDKFRALFHNVNMRQGGVMNTGIQSSNGEYFLCIYQDDYIDLQMCEKMYIKAKEDDAEIIICNYAHLSDGIIYIQKPNKGIESTNNNTRMTYFEQNLVWFMLVKKEVVERNKLYFPTNTTSDDTISVFWYYTANRISRVDEVMYFYTDNLYQTHKRQSEHFRELPITYNKLLDYSYYKDLSNEKRCEIDDVLSRFLIIIILRVIFANISKIYDVKSKIAAWNEYKEVLNRLTHSQRLALAINHVDSAIAESDGTDIVSDLVRIIFDINMDYFKFVDRLAKNVVIWGAGIRGKRLAGYLIDYNISFEITDNDPTLYGKKVCGKSVKPWIELMETTDIVIVTPLNVYDEVNAKINNPCIEVIDYIDLL